MYTPPAFREDDPRVLAALIEDVRMATLVTATTEGLQATPLPLLLTGGDDGSPTVLTGHLARANRQWQLAPTGEALAIFQGPDAYVTPSWYASKAEHGKVVPTWNYSAVHVYGTLEFFDDEAELHRIVAELTDHHERDRAEPWRVSDAPAAFMRGQLKGIVGLRLSITRMEGKRKLSQNRSDADRQGVSRGLAESARPAERAMAATIPTGPR